MVVASRMAPKAMLGPQHILVKPPKMHRMQQLDWPLCRQL